jgi:GxxExxY protein
MLEKELTERIIGALIEVHRIAGPGLLESAYKQCLCHELNLRGLRCQTEVDLPVVYKGVKLDCGYRIDMIVEDTVILEFKCVEKIMPVHKAQLLTYLRLSGKRIGLKNFHEAILIDGLVRMVL